MIRTVHLTMPTKPHVLPWRDENTINVWSRGMDNGPRLDSGISGDDNACVWSNDTHQQLMEYNKY